MQHQRSSLEFFWVPNSQPYTGVRMQNTAPGEEILISFHTLCHLLKIRSHSCNCKSYQPGRTVKQPVVNISCFFLLPIASPSRHAEEWRQRKLLSHCCCLTAPEWDWCDTTEKCCCLLLTESAREWLLLPRDLWGATVRVDTLLLSASGKIRVEPTKVLDLSISIKPCIHRGWLTNH